MEEITTIKIQKGTKERIDKLRSHKRETYDELLQRVLSILNLARVSPERAQRRLVAIDRQKKMLERPDVRKV